MVSIISWTCAPEPPPPQNKENFTTLTGAATRIDSSPTLPTSPQNGYSGELGSRGQWTEADEMQSKIDRAKNDDDSQVPNHLNQPLIDPMARIGHVHLKVADLERAVNFYCNVLGFKLTQRYGKSAVFLASGDYHHHIGLNTWESLGGSPPPAGSTGLYHFAILYATRAGLADALQRLNTAGIPLDGASDHGVSEALYLKDPDHNGIELYWDKPESQWPRTADGSLDMFTRPLDLTDLLAER